MSFMMPSYLNPLFTRDRAGNSHYSGITGSDQPWGTFGGSNLEVANNHPILSGALLFISKLFSQADFYIENKKTGERITDHWLLDLLSKPNYYQYQSDFLEAMNFVLIAQGSSVIWKRQTTGMSEPTALYVLDPNKITYPDNFKTPLSKSVENNAVKKQYINYSLDDSKPDEKIFVKDLIWFYDLPNGFNQQNMFHSASRLDGLKQTLLNTKDSLLAKNVILRTNGKEMISGKSAAGTFPLSNEEKKDAEDLLQNKYGLGFGRKRSIVTKAELTWKSMHIALRDLGLDESVKVDGNLIYTALHIPKDILSLEAKKTTYNNFKESMVSFVQNEMQPLVDSFSEAFSGLLEDGLVLKGTYENLPIMQFVLLQFYDVKKKKGDALLSLRKAGLPDEVALEEIGYDPTIKLNPISNGKEEANGSGETNEDGED